MNMTANTYNLCRFRGFSSNLTFPISVRGVADHANSVNILALFFEKYLRD